MTGDPILFLERDRFSSYPNSRFRSYLAIQQVPGIPPRTVNVSPWLTSETEAIQSGRQFCLDRVGYEVGFIPVISEPDTHFLKGGH